MSYHTNTPELVYTGLYLRFSKIKKHIKVNRRAEMTAGTCSPPHQGTFAHPVEYFTTTHFLNTGIYTTVDIRHIKLYVCEKY
jgi:hypothetical protein